MLLGSELVYKPTLFAYRNRYKYYYRSIYFLNYFVFAKLTDIEDLDPAFGHRLSGGRHSVVVWAASPHIQLRMQLQRGSPALISSAAQQPMVRLFVGGIVHETNTYATEIFGFTELSDFGI